MNIKLEKGLLGLEDYKNFEIQDVPENDYFKILQCIDDKDFSMVIMSPFDSYKDYEIELNDYVIQSLKIASEKEVLVYTTVTLNSDMKKTTTNLRAPIVINITNGLAEQVILQNEKYKIKSPIIVEE